MLAVESVSVVPAIVKRVRVHKTEDGTPKKRVKKTEAAKAADPAPEASETPAAAEHRLERSEESERTERPERPERSEESERPERSERPAEQDSQKTEDDPSLQRPDDAPKAADPVDRHAEYIRHVESLQEQLAVIFKSLQIAKTESKTIQKMYNQIARDFAKRTVRRRASNNQNTGFKMPKTISKQLADFMAVPHDQLVSRAEAGAAIMRYIKEKNLQPAENRRAFVPDEYLKTIVGESESYAFLFIQKYLNPHFKQ